MNEIINLGNGAFIKVTMLKGQQGDNIQSIVKTNTNVLVDTYTITLTDGSEHTFTVTNGKGIVSIEKTDTAGLVDTYTITFNDNTTQTLTVTNGKGIVSIEKTSTMGLVDTYTITFNNSTTQTFNVTNGKGIVSIAKTGTAGLVDTYTITFNDNTTQTFDVTNGANGQDVAQSNLAPVETGNTASQSYAVGNHLIWNGVYYEVIQAIAQDETLNIGVNIQRAIVSNEIETIINQFIKQSASSIILGHSNDTGKNIKLYMNYSHGTFPSRYKALGSMYSRLYGVIGFYKKHGTTDNWKQIGIDNGNNSDLYFVLYSSSDYVYRSNPRLYCNNTNTDYDYCYAFLHQD